MKRAVLLLGMVTLIAGCIYLKNADKDTVLFEQHVNEGIVYVREYPIEHTEEIKEETTQESSTLSEKEAEQPKESTAVIEGGQYAFSKLNPAEQKIYVEILNSLLSYETETELSTTDASIIDKAFNCVMLDHPEIFYVDGYKYTEYTRGEVVEKILFAGNYLYEETEKIRRQKEIDLAAGQILEEVPQTQDEYLKGKYIYDTLVQQTEYDLAAVDNQNICSVFLYGKSVCQGYAKAVQYLLQKLDMESVLVLGTVTNGEGHAWNLVFVNGEWYYLDATWGDAFYLFGDEGEQISKAETAMINYDYLCVTTKQLLQTHTINMPIALPECKDMTDNYYVREGLYVSAFDETQIQNIFRNAVSNGQEAVTIKCSSPQVYEEISYKLLNEQRVFDYLSKEGTIAYIDNQEQCSLTFWL